MLRRRLQLSREPVFIEQSILALYQHSIDGAPTTVLMVDFWLFGSGGKGTHFEASEVVLPATTTA
jgi:hypothetical protein